MSAMNNALDGINRLDVKEKVSELGDMTIETVKNETENKREKKNQELVGHGTTTYIVCVCV